MNDLFNQWNPYITIIGFIVGVVGLPLSYYFYNKGKVKKEVGIYLQNFRLLHEHARSLNKLFVSYDTETISNLTVSEMYFWNNGNALIKADDIVKLSPLTIHSKGEGKILEIVISKVIENTNNFRLVATGLESKATGMVFDYIEPNQGCIFTIYHTGNIIALEGKIQGTKIKRYSEVPVKKKLKWIEKNAAVPAGLFFSLMGLATLVIRGSLNGLLPLVFGLFFIFLTLYQNKKKPPKIFNETDSIFTYRDQHSE